MPGPAPNGGVTRGALMAREQKSREGGSRGPKMEAIATGPDAALADHRRHPGCGLQLVCALCGWAKGYSPERVIARLQELRAGGHRTLLSDVVRRVAWPCPGCGRVRWRAQFAWPAELDAREARRLANRYRN
jgi:hypothetical protein